MRLQHSFEISINNNLIIGNGQQGIMLISNCTNGSYSGNNLYKNDKYGIIINKGSSNNNTIQENIFIHNNGTGNVHDPMKSQARDDDVSNQWYNETSQRGNFWWDRRIPDADENGIIDVP